MTDYLCLQITLSSFIFLLSAAYLILPKLKYIQHMNSITILVPNPYVPIRRKDKQPVTVEDLYKGDHFEYHLNFFNPEKQDIVSYISTIRYNCKIVHISGNVNFYFIRQVGQFLAKLSRPIYIVAVPVL